MLSTSFWLTFFIVNKKPSAIVKMPVIRKGIISFDSFKKNAAIIGTINNAPICFKNVPRILKIILYLMV